MVKTFRFVVYLHKIYVIPSCTPGYITHVSRNFVSVFSVGSKLLEFDIFYQSR